MRRWPPTVGARFTAVQLWSSSGTAALRVQPQQAAAEQQQQRQYRELGAADALLTAVAVVPGEHQDDRQADRENDASRSA